MQRRGFITATIATFSGVSLTGCSSDTNYEDGNDGGGSNDGDTSDSDKKLDILDHELVREDEGSMGESVKVAGMAENVSGGNLGYAEVKAKFYDENEALLESFLDNVNDLGDGEKWSFEIQYPGIGEDAQEVASYKVGAGSNF